VSSLVHCSTDAVQTGPHGTYEDELDEMIDDEEEKACGRKRACWRRR
jgi:hypothetical protein